MMESGLGSVLAYSRRQYGRRGKINMEKAAEIG